MTAAATDRDAEAFVPTLRRLIAALHDGHGGVYPQHGRPQAAPPVVFEIVGGRIVVKYVAKEAAGQVIAAGDVVLAIDGRPAEKVLAETVPLISSATPQWMRYQLAQQAALGPRDSTVRLRLEPFRKDGKRHTVELPRKLMPTELSEPRLQSVAEIQPGFFYVNIDQITDDEYEKALPLLSKASGIIFDFRGYPRHLNNPIQLLGTLGGPTTLKSAQWIIPLVTQPDHVNLTFQRSGEWQVPPHAPTLKAPKVFLIDGRAISYTESCLSIIEHYKLGTLVGEATAGTNGNVNPIVLPGDIRVTWTGMKVLKQDGSRHHGVGILPNVPVRPTREGIAAGRDEVLERGIQVVKSIISR